MSNVSDFQTATESIGELQEYYERNKEDRNEATTRLQLIDRLLFDCLGWRRADCETEEREAGVYTDYSFSIVRRTFILEAKREGKYFTLPAGRQSDTYSIPSLCRGNSDLCDAIDQVAGYCQSRGVPIAAVCNGHQLVAFIAVSSDGVSPLEGSALVFESVQEMNRRFRQLWDCLSRPGVEEGHIFTLLNDSRSSVPPPLSRSLQNYPGHKDRNSFQQNLRILAELVLEDIPRQPELEETFLRDCYCQSGVLSDYASVTRNILLSRYDEIGTPDGSGFSESTPKPTLESAVDTSGTKDIFSEGLSRRPILLIGDVGVGKTSFIRNLIKVEARDLFENAISLHINLGREAVSSRDLKDYVIRKISKQLNNDYEIDIEKRNFVRGVYHGELQRMKRGIYKDLYESDKSAYRLKEIEFLESLISDSAEHMKKCIYQISQGHGRQVVLFIDNADQRSREVQEEAFLVAHDIASNWDATVFLALRPETYHDSLKTGALSGYHPKAFTISPPRVTEVISKRLNFALRVARGEFPILNMDRARSYGNLHILTAILEAFRESLEKNRELPKAIYNISGGNVREALKFVSQFFGSGHVDTEKIADKYIHNGSYYVPTHEFLRAITFGDYEYYDPSISPIGNLFHIGSADPKEHFLAPLSLSFMISRSRGETSGFIETTQLYEELQNAGFNPKQIDSCLERCYEKDLITTAGRTSVENNVSGLPKTMRISTVGAYHMQSLINQFEYVDAVVIATPILDREARIRIKPVDSGYILSRLDRAEIFIQYLDEQWLSLPVKPLYFNWQTSSSNLKADINHIRRKVDS